MAVEKILELIDGYRDDIIQLQKELTKRVALGPDNGGSGEHDKAKYLKEKLEELEPDELEEIRAPDERVAQGYRPNLVAKWQGKRPHPTVWVLSHMDVVPPGDLSLWNTDPYVVSVEGDKIIGRGVEDNHHGIVSSYLPVKAMRESGSDFEQGVGLIFVADEETGSKFGLDYVLRNRGDLFHSEDLIIVPDGGNEDGTMIEVAEKTMLWIRFTVTGKQCHASTPAKGRNSLYGAARLIVDLEKLKEEFALQDELFAPPDSTFAPTKIEANVPNINTIPGKDVFYMDCRILPGYDPDGIIESAKKRAGALAKELDLSIEVEPVYKQVAANPTSPDAPVVKALARAIRRVKGVDAKAMGIGGGTVAAFFREADLPAAVWITQADTAHQPNEFCFISNIAADAKVFACVYLGEY